jgi:hypothetical protein
MRPSWPQARPHGSSVAKIPSPMPATDLLHRREGGVRQDPPREEGGVEAGEVVYVRDDCARRPGNVRVVAAVVEIRQAPRARQLGVLEPERAKDALLELLCVRDPCHLLDDEPERDVVRVRVARPAARLERQRLGGREAQNVDRVKGGRSERPLEPRRVVGVVREPRAVLEQVADGDLVPAGDDPRQVVGESPVEPELRLLDELEHDRRRECLRDAADAEALIYLWTAGTRRGHVLLAVAGDEDDHALGTRACKLLRHAPDRGRRAGLAACARRRLCPGDYGQPHRDEADRAQVLDAIRGHLTRPPRIDSVTEWRSRAAPLQVRIGVHPSSRTDPNQAGPRQARPPATTRTVPVDRSNTITKCARIRSPEGLVRMSA